MARRNQSSKHGTTNRRALLASGRQVDPSDPNEAARKKKRYQQWQDDAWRYQHEIPEIAFAYMFIGNALRRARLTIAIPDPEGGAPITVEKTDENGNPITDSATRAAYDALDRLQASSGGQGAVISGLGVNVGVVGESYLVGWHPDGPDGDEEWDAFSPQQIVADGGDWYLQTLPGTTKEQMTKLGPEDFICRIWNRDQQWRDLAFSAMRPLLGICDELLILTRAIRASALSQLAGAGMLLVPDEISFGSVDPNEDAGDGSDPDPFTQDLIDVMTTPIQDPSSPAATVPFVVRGPAEMLKPDSFRLISFARNVDPEQAKQRDECLQRLANGLDLPAELIRGLANSNHWNAWIIDDQTFTAHIEPLLTLVCWGLTSGYLRPALEGTEAEGQNFMVWYDASAMVKHPNQAEDAQDAIGEAAISFEAYRRAKGFAESDAMDDEDFERWQQVQAAKRGTTVADADMMAEGTEPQGDNADDSTVSKSAPEKPEPMPSEPSPIRASASPDRLPVGAELVEIERILRRRLTDIAEVAMSRALEMAGASVRRKIGKGELSRAIDGVSNGMVAATLGQQVVRQFADQATIDTTVAAAFVGLRPKWDALTVQAQRRVVDIANREGADVDVDEYVARQEANRDAGWAVLVAGLTSLAATRLYDPNPMAPQLGEFDSTTNIPQTLIGGALSIAGGARGRVTDTGMVVIFDANGREVPAGGIATGKDALDLMGEAGMTNTGMIWSCGSPDRPFEPHQNLDGVEFADFSDDALAADPGEFPYVSVYAPGDHDGCQCLVAPVLEGAVVDIPEDEAA